MNIKSQSISEEMKGSYINYAMSVIVARALPDVRDGLKPVQRRILYSMYRLGILPSKSYKKSARTVGDVIAKYHPHSDASIYDALARMAQEFTLRYPLIDGQGNFGSIDGDSPAAMRYTEARLDKLSLKIINEIDAKTVEFIENYDGSTRQPAVLPSQIPNLLLNGASGIAVGMATNIPPHNFGELSDALIAMLKKGNDWKPGERKIKPIEIKTVADLERLDVKRFPKFNSSLEITDLMEFVQGPDFPGGAEVYDQKEIQEAYATGRGRILMRAVASIEESKGGKFQIIVTELPYQVIKSRLVLKIAELVKAKKIDGVTDIRDESNREGIRVVIDLKRDGKPKTVLNKLYKFTEMQKVFNMNLLALVHGDPIVLNLKRVLELFIEHRQEVIIRKSEYDLARAREREHILEGLLIAIDNIDRVIALIRKSKDDTTAKKNLMKEFKLSEIQATAILDMQLRRLSALERLKVEEEYKEVQKKIKDLLDILAKPERVLTIVREQISELREKYGDERRTKVIKGNVGEFNEEDLIANEDAVITVSAKGYIKRMRGETYETQKRGGKGKIGMTMKDDDVVAHIFSCKTHDDILFFTDKGRVFKLKVYEIPEFSRTAKGQPVINLINIEQGEMVTSILTKSKSGILGEDTLQEGEQTSEHQGKDYKYLFMATKSGIVKKTSIEEFEGIRTNGLIAINLDSNDSLSWVKPTTGSNDILLVTQNARSIHFNEKDVRPTGRATRGVRGILFKDKNDIVISMDVTRRNEDAVLTVSENGFGKMSDMKTYPIQNRGGQGVFAARVNKKTGSLIAARIIDHPNAELLIISQHGNTVRIPISDLPRRNRQTAGVTLIRMSKGDQVAAVAIV